MDEVTTTISPASSFHASDYTSDDDSLGEIEERIHHERPTRDRLLRPVSNSSSSSSGGSPWADGTASSSSVSYETDPVPRRTRVVDGSVWTGADSTHPIDVTAIRSIVATTQASPPVGQRPPPRRSGKRPYHSPQRERRAMDDERIERIVALQSGRTPSHRPEQVRHPHQQYLYKNQSTNDTATPPISNTKSNRCVPAIVSPEAVVPEDDISTIGGHYRGAYSPAIFLHNMIQQCGTKQWDVERGRKAKESTAVGDDVRHRSLSCCMYRNDFELFLIVIIAASLLTLVVLLALILATR